VTCSENSILILFHVHISIQLHILLTPVPSFGKSIISQFDSREDLIQANMASVHLVSHGHTISRISQDTSDF